MVMMKYTRFNFNVSIFTLLLATCCSVTPSNRDSSMHLAYECIFLYPPIPDKLPVIFLHGLADLKETWEGIYEVIPFATGRSVCIYDARNHGDSSWSDTFNVDVLAEDLGNFMSDRGIKRASLVGHSLGGLTVMKFALKNPKKVESIFVEDISPANARQDITDNIRYTLKVLQDSLSVIPADADEETAINAVLDYFTKVTNYTLPEQSFNKSPLRCKDGVWEWKANAEVFIKALEDVDSFIGKMEGLYDGRSFFIYGEESEFRVFEDKELILELFPKAEFFGVKGADHIVHAHRAIYINKLVKFLNSLNSVQE